MNKSANLSFKIVETTTGKLRGFGPDKHTWAWYGVPYAAPPMGPLRWQPPAPLPPWSAVRDATAYGDQAAQDPFFKPHGLGGMSENCLHLNITAPRDVCDLPVMVWFHGGAFMALTSNMKSYNNPAGLPLKGVVLVTVNHRLGPFGYFAHPLLSATSGYAGSGNYGQMDLIAALEWIRDNIANFGGNPDNITLFGQSGGGAKAISLMASPLAVGLFHKVICQSGMVGSTSGFMNADDLTTAEAKGLDLAKRLGVATLEQMRAVPWETIVASDIKAHGQKIGIYRPNIDSYYMQYAQLKAIQIGLASDVPLMAGATTSDRVLEGELITGLLEQMPLRAAHCKAPQYVYQFDHVPYGWRRMGASAYHGVDLTYLFNYPNSFIDHFRFGLTGLSPKNLGGRTLDGSDLSAAEIFASTGYGEEDKQLTDTVMTLWTNFAKIGNPSIAPALQWRPYKNSPDADGDCFLHIGVPSGMHKGLAKAFANL